MAAITVRNLDDDVQRRIKLRAARNNRSMEAEARAILTSAVERGGFVEAWLELADEHRGLELTLPQRSSARDVDLE